MKSFADYLPTMTKREREIIEAFHHTDEVAFDARFIRHYTRLELMRQTPPAEEPESVDGRWTIVRGIGQAFVWESPLAFKLGDRVRIAKIEGDGR